MMDDKQFHNLRSELGNAKRKVNILRGAIYNLERKARALEDALDRIIFFNPAYEYSFEDARNIAREALEFYREPRPEKD